MRQEERNEQREPREGAHVIPVSLASVSVVEIGVFVAGVCVVGVPGGVEITVVG